jgi:hypothetical protein
MIFAGISAAGRNPDLNVGFGKLLTCYAIVYANYDPKFGSCGSENGASTRNH